MHACVLRMEIHVGHSRSLKDKRQVLRGLLDGARARFSVAASEVDHQDTWQRATVAFAAVGPDAGAVEHVLDSLERWIWSHPEFAVVGAERVWWEDR
jgi:uncharacterized protein YlxP (DUF503 family)